MAHVRFFEGVAHARSYLRYRPTYPPELFQKVMSFLSEKRPPPHEVHVDVCCGSGQGTDGMSSRFQRVIGFDISPAQVETATKANTAPNVEFKVSPAEKLPLEDQSVDLITCAAAAHWLDFEAFTNESNRVLKPNGCLAVYCYGVPWIEHEDASLQKSLAEDIIDLRLNKLAPYWTDRSRLVVNKYEGLTIPFPDFIRDDNIEFTFDWSVSHFMGFLKSLSFSQKYLADEPSGKLFQDYLKRLLAAVSSPDASPDASPDDTMVRVAFPFFLLLGRTSGNRTTKMGPLR